MKGRFARACAPIAFGDGFLHDNVRTKTKKSEGQMFFSNSDGNRIRGRGRRGRFDLSHEGNSNLRQEGGSHRGTFGRRGSFDTEQGRQTMPLAITAATSAIAKRSAEKKEASQLPQTENSQTMPPTPNTTTMVDHRANSRTTTDSKSSSNSEDVWFVDSSASHHMRSHQ